VTCTTYSINLSVFITEMKSVYSAVRTGSLNKAVWRFVFRGLNNIEKLCVHTVVKSLTVQWSITVCFWDNLYIK
jgi:hypothetical protein